MAATMAKKTSALQKLAGDQALASAPDAHIWLSASAGTGKTHVLTARVFRLLLQGTRPENILCLTFTKAGAAEMADRINDRLAAWVQMDGPSLAKDLMALGESHGPEMQDIARRLFAEVLESTGGGLRIQTIHGFCQQLLATFPLEAELTPGFRPLDQREQKNLARETLAELVVRAQEEGDDRLFDALQAISFRLGEQGAEQFLLRCAAHLDALEQIDVNPLPWITKEFGLPDGDIEAYITEQCDDSAFDIAALKWVTQANVDWGSGRGISRAERIGDWRALSPSDRSAALTDLHSAWSKADGDLITTKGWVPPVDGYVDVTERLHRHCAQLLELRTQAAYARLLAKAFYAGRAYARAYNEAKQINGAVDFDDLIARTAKLLQQPAISDWIRYKLDQQIDHILVDEAQDTNVYQWQIVGALASEFFAGEWLDGEKVRTIFTVGDYKQAIFGFQGTNPAAFRAAQSVFEAHARGVEHSFHALSLERSFRSTPAVLEVVDKTIETLKVDRFGLPPQTVQHISANRYPGEVLMWRPTISSLSDDAEGEEDWLSDQDRKLAENVADQIKYWIDSGMMLESQGRPVTAGDIMILVRRRSELARLIVARLYEKRVAVAGIDRIRLNAPLAVRDLLAALRFALQPDDDLNLASLLVSPLIGWSQQDLMQHLAGRKRGSLWRQLHNKLDESVLAPLRELLAKADLTTPYRYLEMILSGEMQGRRKLLERLGPSAADPIEELLNAALTFEADEHMSLQRFVSWFDQGEVEIVRDAAAQGDALRLLTVHGAKGLQAPIVILADACLDPDAGNRADSLLWNDLPIIPPRKHERQGSIGQLSEDSSKEDREEHWRLLYVALTRAEEKLVVTGSLGPRAKGAAKSESWYVAVQNAMESLGAQWEENSIWGGQLRWRGTEELKPKDARTDFADEVTVLVDEPHWLRQNAPMEARPPRPLTPSVPVEDDISNPPPTPSMRASAERGRLLHSLFEKLPNISINDRRERADSWLQHQGIAEFERRQEIVTHAINVIEDSAFENLFAPHALAEAPIVAVVGEAVISGTVDRLCISDDVIQFVDFKTGHYAPFSEADVPKAHIRQMAAYAAALAAIFPGRKIEGGLLYTSAPRLIPLSMEILDRYKPGLLPAQQNLPLSPVEAGASIS